MHRQESEASATVCLYRRAGERAWWRVDASVTPQGHIDIVSGDSNEWHALIRADHVDLLLRVLRRGGDLIASIGSLPALEVLARLHEAFACEPPQQPPFEAIKAFLDHNAIPWEPQFWAGDTDNEAGEPFAMPPTDSGRLEILAILGHMRALVAAPGNDFTYSGWAGATDALDEIDRLTSSLGDERSPDLSTLHLLFAPAGPLQELSMASGWREAYLEIATRFELSTKLTE